MRAGADAAGASRARRLLALLGLSALVFVAYAPSLFGPFVFDDRVYLVDNARLRALSLGELFRLFAEPYQRWEWLPVRDLSYVLELHVFGLSPFAFHLDNVLLYLASVAAFGFFAAEAFRFDRARPHLGEAGERFVLVAVAVFAAHPAHVESAAWISGRKDVLMGLFVFGGLGLAARAAREESNALARILFGALAFVAGVLSKGAAVAGVTFLAALFILARRRRHGEGARRLGLSLLAWIALASLLGLHHAATSHALGLRVHGLGEWARAEGEALLPLRVLGYLVGIAFAPRGLRLHYDVLAPGWPAMLHTALGALALVAAAVAVFRLVRGSGGLAALGVVGFVGSAIPYLQILPFRTWSLASERFLFLSIAGLALVLAALFERAVELGRHRVARVVFALAVGAALLVSTRRSAAFADEKGLLAESVARSPEHGEAVSLYLGRVLLPERRFAEARAAVARLRPDPRNRILDAWIEVEEGLARGDASALDALCAEDAPADRQHLAGEVLLRLGRTREAIRHFHAAALERPELLPSLHRAQAILAPSVAPLRARVARDPSDLGARLALAMRCMDIYLLDEARTHLRYLLERDRDPSHRAALLYDLGLVAAREGRYEEARTSFVRALSLGGGDARVREALQASLARTTEE